MLGRLLDQRYRVIKVLGSGGFSQTYIAEDTRRPSFPQCVVKHLKPFRSDPSFLHEVKIRFQTEAKALERLGTHNQIPQLLACFEDDQELFLVLEFIEGHSLSEEILASRRLSEAEVVALLQDVLGVLAFVHSQQVIHRDIKPDNLIRRRQDGRIVLIDFGAVKAIQTQMAKSPPTIRIGTPGYAPPEQDTGNPSYSSDFYALGMTAVQALTGLYPGQLVNPETGKISWEDKVEISHGLAAILARMISYSPAGRYQSAQECLDGLTKLAAPSDIALATVQIAGPQRNKISNLIPYNKLPFSSLVGVGLIFGLIVAGTLLGASRSQMAQATLKEVRQLQAERNYQDCSAQAEELARDLSIGFKLRGQAQELFKQCQVAIARQTVQKAKRFAASGNLVNAITIASQVSKDSQLAAEAQWLTENWTGRLLELGWDQYHAGKLDTAIAYAYAIPATATNYKAAQADMTQWREKWQIAKSQFDQAQRALNQDQWQQAISIAQRAPAPDNRFWQARLESIARKAEAAKQTEETKRNRQVAQVLKLLNRDRNQIGKTALEKAYPDKVFRDTEKFSELRVRRKSDQVTFRLVVVSQGWFWSTETITFDWQVMMAEKRHVQVSIGNGKKLDAYHSEELNNYFFMLTEDYL